MKEIDRALDELVIAARRFEYWKTHGRHGDGKLDEAKQNLKDARKNVKLAIREATK